MFTGIIKDHRVLLNRPAISSPKGPSGISSLDLSWATVYITCMADTKHSQAGNVSHNCRSVRLPSVFLLANKISSDKTLTWADGTPCHGLLRVYSSHIMTPRLNISHFSVNGSFRMSSGAIHSGVPADEEALIGVMLSTRESPKSQILTVQYLLTKQFALFKSRWATFIRCMHIRPLTHQKKNALIYIIQHAWKGAVHY